MLVVVVLTDEISVKSTMINNALVLEIVVERQTCS